jgi:uncharacterized MAPEG superfamily protein
MTPELWWTTLTALLAGGLWIPYIVGVNTDPAEADNFTRPGDPSLLRPWVHRAHRAHLNLLEQFLPMAALVLIAHAAGVTSAVTVWATGLFFALRLAHAVGMITGAARFPARPAIFLAGFACVIAMGVEILRLG